MKRCRGETAIGGDISDDVLKGPTESLQSLTEATLPKKHLSKEEVDPSQKKKMKAILEDDSNVLQQNNQCYSKSFQYMIKDRTGNSDNGGGDSISYFFQHIWQRQVKIFKHSPPEVSTKRTNKDADSSNNDKYEWCHSEVMRNVLKFDTHDLADLLRRASTLLPNDDDNDNTLAINEDDEELPLDPSTRNSPPLVFQNQIPIPYPELHQTYNPTNSTNPLYHAYVDGCSVVLNHADKISPQLASLCLDLQRSFPHVYVNTYLTPPCGQAVKAHADDRDVLVVQLIGKKHWIVYENPPISYPYPKEQVGKSDSYPVPKEYRPPNGNASQLGTSERLQGMVVNEELCEGDILYIPRGYVHEAKTNTEEASFHATIAIATHDWSLSVNLSDMIRKSLDCTPEYRMAIPFQFGMGSCPHNDGTVNNSTSAIKDQTVTSRIASDSNGTCVSNSSFHIQEKDILQGQLDRAVQIVKESFTIDTITSQMRNKYNLHNDFADQIRKNLIHNDSYYSRKMKKSHEEHGTAHKTIPVVGPVAAKRIRMNTQLRAASPQERSSISMKTMKNPVEQSQQRGLSVRPETSEYLLSIVGQMKQNMCNSWSANQFRSLMMDIDMENGLGDHIESSNQIGGMLLCDNLTLLCFARLCVELGVLALA